MLNCRLVMVLAAMLCVGCARTAREQDVALKQPSVELAPDELPVIGRLVGRERTITMLAAPEGVLYSVESAEGRVLVRASGEEQLRAALPEVYRQIKSSVAIGCVDR